jgi:signal transduction histidine kinase
MELLWDLIAQIQFGKSGHVSVITKEGQLIAHEFPQVVLANVPLSTQPQMNAIAQAGDHQWMGTYTNSLGEKVLSITQPVWGTSWIIVSETPFNDSFSISRRALMVLVFGIVMFGVLATFMTFTALQRLVLDPIEALRSTLQWVGRGEFNHQVTIYRQDEVGQVAQGFNEMVASLNKRDNELAAKTTALATEVLEHKKTQDELEQLNRTLEQRVKDRTAELEKITTDLKRSNNELQEFAYVASHDLQEPLRKVRTFGDRLVEKYSNVLDARAQDYIARMQNGAARMQVLIDALLTYSRVATNAQPFVALDLKQVAQDVVNDLEQQIERVGGEVQLGELDVIYSDPLQMRQLLQNLISNGLKFHRPDEKPVVKVYGQWINGGNPEAPYQRSYRLVVQDNGIGIPAEYANQIFQVFQRLHGRSEYEGTGIGLAICRKIVERHRGTIAATGEPGEGATFVITLPQLQPSQTSVEES